MPDIFDQYADAPAGPESAEGSGSGLLAAGAGVVGAVALAAILRRPGALSKLNALRQQLMLSGKALPKSVLGNAGAVVAESAEQGSMAPLKRFFSRQTWDDAKAAYKANASVGPVGMANTNLPGPMPGRFMGAMDTATQASLRDSGMTAEGAEAALFQTPLGKNWGKLGEKLDSPEARYVLPFRRTPFNQLSTGLDVIKESGPYAQFKGTAAHPRVFNAYTAAGMAHGAATSDEEYPASLPLAAAGAAKYGVPYGAAAIVGRMLAGGNKNSGVAGTMLPISEYGVTQSLTDPFAAFEDPAFSRSYLE